ncbi:FAD-dependent 5-carboxymethylaminomethyl-2-thiouridine(34) oxidoreductase MnmC [Glaciimonas sp. GNP009]
MHKSVPPFLPGAPPPDKSDPASAEGIARDESINTIIDTVVEKSVNTSANTSMNNLLGIASPIDQWQQQDCFTILDTAFDAGGHFLATWQSWCEHPERPQQLHYLALMPTSFSIAELTEAHATWPEWAMHAQELRAVWPTLMAGFHRLYLAHNKIVLTLMIGDSGKCLQQIEARINTFYVHGPAQQLWPLPLLGRLNRLAIPNARLTIVDLSDRQQKSLEQAGFVFENPAIVDNTKNSAGFANTAIAYFLPRWQPTLPTSNPSQNQRHAIIIGAGLAGAAACQRLTLRGWKVSLIERHADIAQEASGNAVGIFMPVLSRDDNPTSRLSRAAYLFARHVWESLGGIGNAFSGASCGVLQIARDADQADAQRRWAAQAKHPNDYAQWLTQSAASALLGTEVNHGGWRFPGGGWVHPRSLCQTMLEACGERLEMHFNRSVSSLIKTVDGWQVCDDKGKGIASAPVVIMANGMGALTFPQTRDLPLTAIRGQVTYLHEDSAPNITQVLCGDGYLTPAADGWHSLGATYDEDHEEILRQKSQNENIVRLQKILPDWKVDTAQLPLAGRVGFRCVSTDRLPLIGALPDPITNSALREPQLKDLPRFPGLYGLLGFASRGLIWAPLAAELLAAELNGEPLPIEAELAAAVDPARFLLRTQRRKKSN